MPRSIKKRANYLNYIIYVALNDIHVGDGKIGKSVELESSNLEYATEKGKIMLKVVTGRGVHGISRSRDIPR